MNVIIKGKIVKINETQTIGDKGFTKRSLILQTLDKYPQELNIEFIKDKCDLLDKLAEGQEVAISTNILGRKWTNPEGVDMWFNSLQGWNIELLIKQEPEPEQAPDQAPDDLPF
ncbi:DUF3127 domain-containing protein [Candidatus Pacearchaeota archaeon]|nr:DUF3127 domain-containing protein [Candidatus Pacearchaeota archaeon]